MDPKSMIEGAGTAAMALGVTAATEPNKIKNGETSAEFKNNDLNKKFYSGYGFMDGTMPYVDPPSLKQRAATGVAGGLMKLLSGLVSDPKDQSESTNPFAVLAQTLSTKVGGTNMPDINSPLGNVGSKAGDGGNVFAPIVNQIGQELGIPAIIGMALGKRESGFNRMAKGKAGEIGAFQVKLDTAREALNNPNLTEDELYDPTTNTRASFSFLGEKKKRLGSWVKALLAYNMGEAGLKKYVPNIDDLDDRAVLAKVPAQPRGYVTGILGENLEGLG